MRVALMACILLACAAAPAVTAGSAAVVQGRTVHAGLRLRFGYGHFHGCGPYLPSFGAYPAAISPFGFYAYPGVSPAFGPPLGGFPYTLFGGGLYGVGGLRGGQGAFYPAAVPAVSQTQVLHLPGSAAPAPAPPASREQQGPPREGERFYLDRRSAPAADPVDALAAQVRVELAEPGVYLVRWTGAETDVASVELQSRDATGQLLGSRVLRDAPFRGLLRVPADTASVSISIQYAGGSGVSVKLPVDRFRKLDAAPAPPGSGVPG